MELQYTTHSIPAFLLAFIPALINLILAVYVYFKMPQRFLTGLFAVDLIFTMCWQTGSAITRISADAYTANFWDGLLEPFGLLCAPLILHFALLFTQKNKDVKYTRIVYAFYFITFILALAYPVFNSSANYIYNRYWGWVNTRPKTMYSNILGLFLQVQYILAIGILAKALFKAKKRSNEFYQLLLIDTCLVIIIMQAIITEGILPQVYHITFPVTSSVIAVYTVAVFIALKKFRLFGGFEAIDKQELLGSISDIVIVINSDLSISYINESGLQHIGNTLNEIEGLPVSTILNFADDNNVHFLLDVVSPALSGAYVRNVKCRLISKNGEMTPVLLSADIVKSSSQNEGILLVCRSISDLEKAQTEVRKNSAYLEQLFAASPFAITTLDTGGRILAANPAFEKIFQFSRSEILGTNLSEVMVPPKQKKDVARSFLDVMDGKIVSYETVRYKKNGAHVDVYVIGYPIVIDKEISGCYILYIDISEQKASEKEILLKNEELVKINTELDKFFYSASHDIRAPLTSILGLVNLAETEVIDEESKRYFKMIKESVLKLDYFTLDLIRFANNNRTEVVSNHFNVHELISEIVDTFKNTEEQAGIRFEIVPGNLVSFATDRQRVHDILFQLVSNAVKYQKQENDDPLVRIEAIIKNESLLEIVVEDNGIGIEEHLHGKIFDMFSKLSERSHGAGLGLYIVNEIVAKLNGKINVKSDPGKGSKFAVLIPFLEPTVKILETA
jgi:PAS domain S-box-containing protein